MIYFYFSLIIMGVALLISCACSSHSLVSHGTCTCKLQHAQLTPMHLIVFLVVQNSPFLKPNGKLNVQSLKTLQALFNSPNYLFTFYGSQN